MKVSINNDNRCFRTTVTTAYQRCWWLGGSRQVGREGLSLTPGWGRAQSLARAGTGSIRQRQDGVIKCNQQHQRRSRQVGEGSRPYDWVGTARLDGLLSHSRAGGPAGLPLQLLPGLIMLGWARITLGSESAVGGGDAHDMLTSGPDESRESTAVRWISRAGRVALGKALLSWAGGRQDCTLAAGAGSTEMGPCSMGSGASCPVSCETIEGLDGAPRWHATLCFCRVVCARVST